MLLQANSTGRVFSQRDVAKWCKETRQNIRLDDIGAYISVRNQYKALVLVIVLQLKKKEVKLLEI